MHGGPGPVFVEPTNLLDVHLEAVERQWKGSERAVEKAVEKAVKGP